MMKRNYYKLRTIALGAVLGLFCLSSYGQTVTLPTTDGDGSEAAWDVAETWPLEAIIDVSSVVDAADFSGDVAVLWSADSIYVRVNVLDDDLHNGPGSAYNYDNVCIYFDVFNKGTDHYTDTTQMYYEKNWWAEADQMGGRYGTGWMAPPGNFAVDTADGMTGYTIELAVAWTQLDKVPAVGDKMGFDVKISDNDDDGVDDGAGRDQIAWRDISDGGWNNPMLWGEITLTADGSVDGQTDFIPTTDGMDERAWTFVPAWSLDADIDKSDVTNDADFSGNVKLMWTDDSIYVKVWESDEKLYGGAGDKYNYDNVCIYFDVFNKGTDYYMDSTQMYFEKNWWEAADQMSGRYGTDWMAPPYGNFAVDTMDGMTGYTIELTVGWDEFDKVPAVGDKMGFDVKLSDNDGVDGGAGRDQIAWRDITDGGWNNPELWGEITLEADGVISGQTEFYAIDGVVDGREWALAPSFDIEAGVNGAPTVFNDADLDGSFKLVWNEDQILFSTVVYDDTLYSADGTWYQNDNIAIFFDLLKKNTGSYTDTTQFYYERHWWGADSTGLGARWGADWNWPPADTFHTVLTDTSYTMELALNWTDFITAAPAAGSVIGFDVKLSDRDSEDIARDQVSWEDATDGAWNDPSLFGSMTLLANGNVEAYGGPAAVANLAATVDGATVTLTWDAVDGAAGYNVYRGATLIGDAITEVTLADADLDNGDYTYTVSAIDSYGIESDAATADATVLVGIEHSVMQKASVYPNPASEMLYVKSSELMESISLITVTGQVVNSIVVNDNFRNLDISELKSGLYFVSVRYKASVENYKILIK